MATEIKRFAIRLGFLAEGDADQVQDQYERYLRIWNLINEGANSVEVDWQVAASELELPELEEPPSIGLFAELFEDGLHTLVVILEDAGPPLADGGVLVEAAGRQLWVPTPEAEDLLDGCIKAVFYNLLFDGETLRLAIDQVSAEIGTQTNTVRTKASTKSAKKSPVRSSGAGVSVYKKRNFTDAMKGGIK